MSDSPVCLTKVLVATLRVGIGATILFKGLRITSKMKGGTIIK